MKYRQDQLTDTIKNEVITILLFQVNNPLLKHVIVTRAKMTKDLKIARIYYNIPGSLAEQKKVAMSLNRSKSFIRKLLTPKLNVRFVPELEFYYDESQEELSKLEDLFHRIHKE